jgi:hypothetical protein
MKRLSLIIACSLVLVAGYSQPDRWQQRVKYTMDVKMDVNTNRFAGTQHLEYTNNSPDTLKKLFYHLYWNAFQPNSMMDARSRRQGTLVIRKDRSGNDIVDWDPRVRDRIAKLGPDEIGYQRVSNLKVDGRTQQTKDYETILEVMLDKPILPKGKAIIDLQFEAQTPLQIRRSGRDNAEGVRYSMSQWYPKLCEYDYEGWHPTPYIGREFYGVWGDYEVKLTIDKNYLVCGTGYLQNADKIGFGYEAAGVKVPKPTGPTLTWHFIAPNVHDFMWAADPDYKHVSKKVRADLTLHAFYKISPPHLTAQFDALAPNVKSRYTGGAAQFISQYEDNWKRVVEDAARALPYIEKRFGAYPYKQYSFVHGGDGGMEYPMATLLKGPSLGTVIHEWMHSWYQMMMGTNESLYAWMDEGFTTFAENEIMAFLNNSTNWPHADDYDGYVALAKSGREEPLTTHADHFNTNAAYGTAAYSKGCVFMEQLGYIVGEPVRDKILLEYYRQWRFKHPNVNDFMRVAEKVSGLQLEWYKEYWVNTTKTIDYGIDSLWEEGGVTRIRLRNLGQMPMPIDLRLTFKDGSQEWHYVPMYLMFGSKQAEEGMTGMKVYEPWKWTHPTYVIESNKRLTDLKFVEIDPSGRMADVEREKNNKTELKW